MPYEDDEQGEEKVDVMAWSVKEHVVFFFPCKVAAQAAGAGVCEYSAASFQEAPSDASQATAPGVPPFTEARST